MLLDAHTVSMTRFINANSAELASKLFIMAPNYKSANNALKTVNVVQGPLVKTAWQSSEYLMEHVWKNTDYHARNVTRPIHRTVHHVSVAILT